MRVSGSAKMTMMMVPIVPAKKEPTAEMTERHPHAHCVAIW
jgi:hypothetical protein